MRIARLRRAVWTLTVTVGAATALAAWWWLPADPLRALRARAPALVRVVREPIPGSSAGVERWRLISAAGDTATALWRPAPRGTLDPWTVVLMGGLQTGDRAVLLLPEGPFHALAVDWPWSGPRRLSPWRFLLEAGAIRAAVLRTPGVLARGVEAVARAPEVDARRIALLGASLGAPPALAALRLTPRPAALVLVDGAADLRALMAAGLARLGVPSPLASPLAALGARFVRPLEPSLHLRAAARLPVLLVNSEQDELLPARAVRELHAGLPRADTLWRPGAHVRPGQAREIAAMTAEVTAWLLARPAGGAQLAPR